MHTRRRFGGPDFLVGRYSRHWEKFFQNREELDPASAAFVMG